MKASGMLYVGLTGGIAAGKSLASDFYRDRGAVLIDSDRLAREVVDPSLPGGRRLLAKIAAEFGDEVIGSEGSLDRAVLGKKVFGQGKGKERKKLERILHPPIRKEAVRILSSVGDDAIVVHDIPLLAEMIDSAMYDVDDFDQIVVVIAARRRRAKRMVEGRGMRPSEARARIRAQAPDRARIKIADVVIRNDGTQAETRRQLQCSWEGFLALHAEKSAHAE